MYNRRGYLRNFVFGVEDSIVSTVGLLSGVSFAGLTSRYIIASGIILILVEAISMGAGVFISEDSGNELKTIDRPDNKIVDALIMFFSYLLVGIIPLSPYIFSENTISAFYYSITFSLLSLFAVGVFKGIVVQNNPLWSGMKITLIGAVVIAIAVLVGRVVKV